MQQLGIHDVAIDWLLDLWHVIQIFDDVVDGDPISRGDADEAIWAALVKMPSNPFFIQHAHQLTPALVTMILKWHAADASERDGAADEVSFVWRASYYDVVLLVLSLCVGYAAAMARAPLVLRFYGEKFSDYRKEFSDA
jgi:hypothetical protein